MHTLTCHCCSALTVQSHSSCLNTVFTNHVGTQAFGCCVLSCPFWGVLFASLCVPPASRYPHLRPPHPCVSRLPNQSLIRTMSNDVRVRQYEDNNPSPAALAFLTGYRCMSSGIFFFPRSANSSYTYVGVHINAHEHRRQLVEDVLRLHAHVRGRAYQCT